MPGSGKREENNILWKPQRDKIRTRRIQKQVPIVARLLHGARVQRVPPLPAVFVVGPAAEQGRDGVVAGRAGGLAVGGCGEGVEGVAEGEGGQD